MAWIPFSEIEATYMIIQFFHGQFFFVYRLIHLFTRRRIKKNRFEFIQKSICIPSFLHWSPSFINTSLISLRDASLLSPQWLFTRLSFTHLFTHSFVHSPTLLIWRREPRLLRSDRRLTWLIADGGREEAEGGRWGEEGEVYTAPYLPLTRNTTTARYSLHNLAGFPAIKSEREKEKENTEGVTRNRTGWP